MCHAPIVIPSIAGAARRTTARRTTRAMRETRAHAARARAGADRAGQSARAAPAAQLGHRARRRSCRAASRASAIPSLRCAFRGAPEAARALARERPRARPRDATHCRATAARPRRARAALLRARGRLPRAACCWSPCPSPAPAPSGAFGEALRGARARACGERWAVLASGDMSHRLTRGAPAGFDPRARDFDARFVRALRRGDLRARRVARRASWPSAPPRTWCSRPRWRPAPSASRADGTRVLAYEGPFGVGYCEALLHSDQPSQHALDARAGMPSRRRALAEIALDAIAPRSPASPSRRRPARARRGAPRAVFVTLRSRRRRAARLHRPHRAASTPRLAAEVADCAVGAATRDYRVRRVELGELATCASR